jgi:predicted O-linked N-acetylglucosamine transferase (SPINDLY family)
MTDRESSAKALEAAIELARRGALAQAERALHALIEDDPTLARAYNVLGVVQLQQGNLDAAEVSLLKAVRLAPNDTRVHLNLGKLYATLLRPGVAEGHLREAVRLDSRNADAHFNLAVFLRGQGRLAEAEASYLGAIRAEPADVETRYQLARLLLETLQFAQAETHFREVLRLQPGHAVARNDLALVLLETGRLAEAEESLREAIRVNPDFLRARCNYVMCGQYDPGATDAELLRRALEAGRALQAAASRFPPTPAPVAGRTAFSLGFVSGDLHHHPIGLFLLPLIHELKNRNVRVQLYSTGAVHDEVSARLGSLAEWRDIAQQSDEEAWTRIRSDPPEVLIDLAGHTGNNRLAVFAARAAARQVSWLGYFATTGTPNVDCVLMDPWHAPDGCESQFSERVLRLPHSRFCFQPIVAAPEVAPPPSSTRSHVTFGSFNSISKINDRVIGVWSRVLQRAPGSKLVLKWRTLGDLQFRRVLAARFQRAGIEPERLEFRGASEHAAMLGEYADIDVALDPFPFTGGQTSFEAHWMGVPVVTLPGHRPVSRQTFCILGNLGMLEQAAASEDEYVEHALRLASDKPLLRELRFSLRRRMLDSPLMDPPAFATAFVDVLTTE